MKTLVNLLFISAVILLTIILSGCKQITGPTENASTDKAATQTLNKANPERPLKGDILYTITEMGEDNIWYTSGTGNLTQLGKCTVAETIYFMEGRGEDIITAADGSQLYIPWYRVGEDPATATFNWTIVGGAGRFAGASGSGVCPPVVWNPDGTFVVEYIGVIKY